jgi:hypothetical protein
MRGSLEYADANRLLCELVSIQVTCEECGHDRSLGFEELSGATFAGAYNYRLLSERLKCSNCPPMPRPWRRLQLSPRWRGASVAGGINNGMD